jgi:hypothetical protein
LEHEGTGSSSGNVLVGSSDKLAYGLVGNRHVQLILGLIEYYGKLWYA